MRGGRLTIGAKLSLLLAAASAVCPTVWGQMPPIDSGNYAAKVIEMTGQVSVLKDDTPWALQVGDQIQVRQLIITGADGQARFQVSDGSTFDVYPNSRVVFRKNAPNWRDLLDVLVGRVKVHIEHLYGPNPNRVLTPSAVISVRGTTFDITVGDDDEATLVEVEEGIVDVRHAVLGGNTKTLTTGESLRVFRNEPIAQSRFDKQAIAQRVYRAAINAITTWESRVPHAGSGSAAGIGVGDTGKKVPPPPPPPPPPPAPPGLPGHMVASNGNDPVPVQHDDAVSVFVVHTEHGRWYRYSHAILRAVMIQLLGPAPGGDVIRAIQQQR
jgi:hypothetical protein